MVIIVLSLRDMNIDLNLIEIENEIEVYIAKDNVI